MHPQKKKNKTSGVSSSSPSNVPNTEIKSDTSAKTKKSRPFPFRMSIWLIASPAILLLIAVIVSIEVFKGNNAIYFNEITLPEKLINTGITKEYIKSNIVGNVNRFNDSIPIKLGQIIDYGTSTGISSAQIEENMKNDLDILAGENDLSLVSGSFNIKVTGLAQYLRKKISSKKDIIVKIQIINIDNTLTANILLEDWSGDVTSVCISENIENYPNLIACIEHLLNKSSLKICHVYNPISSVLADYRYTSNMEDYETVNNWKSTNYTLAQKEQLLSRCIKSDDTMTKKWSSVILGNLYETAGFINNNIRDLKKARQYYNSEEILKDEYLINFAEYKTKLIERYMNKTGTSDDTNNTEILTQLINEKKITTENVSQIIVVAGYDGNLTKAVMYTFGLNTDGQWTSRFEPMDVNIGAHGFAAKDEKTEGDLKTPTGYYPITQVFGYTNDLNTEMPFIEVTPCHIWITDSTRSDYNTIVVDTDNSLRKNGETLLRMDDLNKYAIIVDYNRYPVEKGKGSAIFIHCERSRNHRTAGCISMPEESVKALIEWLRPGCCPHIYMGRL